MLALPRPRGAPPRPMTSPRAPPAAHAPSPSPARGSAQVLVPPRKRGGARSGLNSCLRPPFRTPLVLSPCAPLDPAAGPASALDRPPESPLGLIWVASVSYYGPSSGGRAFFLNFTFSIILAESSGRKQHQTKSSSCPGSTTYMPR